VQKSALKSVNVQRIGKSILQMFAFSFFEGNNICSFLPILRSPTVPRSHFSYPKTKAFTLIISNLYLQIVTSASESRFCVGNNLLSIIPEAVLLMILIQSRLNMILLNTNQQPQSQQNHTVHQVEADMKPKFCPYFRKKISFFAPTFG